MQGFPSQFIRHEALTRPWVLLTTLITYTVCAVAWPVALLKTFVGTGLDTTASRSAVGIEAKYVLPFSSGSFLEAHARLDRPFDKHENFYVPFFKLTGSIRALTREGFNADVRPFVSALALDKWGYDGARARLGFNNVATALPHSDLTLQLELAPWFELSQFRTNPEGRDFPQMGFIEKLSAEGRFRSFFLELSVILQQSHRTLWRNDYGLGQRLGYRFSPEIGVGVAHEILTGRLDESTGYLRPVALFDSRLSRVSLFAEFIL